VVAGHTIVSRHQGSQQDPIVRASLFRNTIADGRTDGRTGRGASVRRDGHLLTLRASPLVRAIRQRYTDESYSSRGCRAGGYCDARNIFIPKVRIVSPAATTCTKDRPPGVAPLRAAFYIFHFRDRAGGAATRGAPYPEALQNAISGLGCWSDFSCG